ncbi:hypothetical protein BACCELL_04567 [Bacteroides cellulosilyticus DSM 14838]|uniref:Uncharacterized protein n=1 Tax=Bacteroides cellulosilyticus DSM 14838 TaxID=537012 RepID=E2NJS8_9BACE|nr:hypothetical protein BACCELL_04567 [Bacteroides cellulosilyticus DSM 14838]
MSYAEVQIYAIPEANANKKAIYFIISAFRNALPHVRSYFVITIFQFMSRIYNPVPNKIEQAIFLKSI